MTEAGLIAWMRALTGLSWTGEVADRIEALSISNATLIAERDHWKDVAGREGVCMTCRGPRGAPEPYGCSDCLNTGYCGEHHNTVADLGAKLAEAVEALEFLEIAATGSGVPHPKERELLHDCIRKARATLAEIKGERHE